MNQVLRNMTAEWMEPIREAAQLGWYLKCYGEPVAHGDRAFFTHTGEHARMMGFDYPDQPGWDPAHTDTRFRLYRHLRCGVATGDSPERIPLLFSPQPADVRLRVLLEQAGLPAELAQYWKHVFMTRATGLEVVVEAERTGVRTRAPGARWAYYTRHIRLGDA
jgi:hypothetical protein